MVMNYYITKKKELTCYFEKQVSLGTRYSLTLDEYTSIQNKRYMNINVHTKDNHWSLGLIEINGSLDSRKTAEIIRRHLHKFGLNLDEHIVGCTTDGAAVMVKFGKEIKPDHEQCIAHCIHLSVLDILYEKKIENIASANEDDEESEENDLEEDSADEAEPSQQDMIIQTDLAHENACFPSPKPEFEKVLKKVRKVCKIFRKSPMKNEILQHFVRANLDGKEYKLILDCRARWSSTFYMIERFLKPKNSIPNALRAVLSTEAISDDEWKTIDILYETLRPVEMILKIICREDADLLTVETSLEFLLNKLMLVNNPLSLKLYQSLVGRCNMRRNVETVSLLRYLHNPKKFKDDSSSKTFVFPTKQVLKKYAEQVYSGLFPGQNVRSTTELSKETENEGNLHQDTNIASSISDNELMREYTEAIKKLNEETEIETSEFEISKEFKYFEATLNRSKSLEKIYKALLTIKATSIQSERAFSITGLFNTKIRTSLSGKTLNALCFLKDRFHKDVDHPASSEG